MLTEEELARAHNQLDMLVQPEGDAALESLMAHIRELQQELAETYAELNRYQAQAFRGVAYEPTEEVNVEIRRARDEKQHRIDLLHRAAATDGAHHKQWLIVRILEAMGEDISAYERGVQP
jgi:hypothetical protein